MSFSRINASAATSTRTRTESSPCSGMCVVCLDGCPGTCEIAMSALRGREMLYPQPFGQVTAGSAKEYPIDFSHFSIQGSCVGAEGVEADSDKAIFPNVDLSLEIGAKEKIRLKVPFFTGALGSTEIARVHWENMAIGAAICGTIIVIGENVCAMDPQSEIKNGRVVRSPEMKRRVGIFKDWDEGYGEVVVQMNVEDTRLKVAEYAIEKLGVRAVELKWGQGAKDIGGEVKLPSLKKALQLNDRGYLVFPNPQDPEVQKEFKEGVFGEFERHSRLGMVDEEEFYRKVEELREVGAKYVTLKTGAYRPRDLARAVKFASTARIDLLTVDGAGGGTGMSPWRMMNEWGIPTVYLECLLYNYLNTLKEMGAFVPPCAMAGGLSLEDHIFKALALGAPYVSATCLGRSSMAAAMVGNTVGEGIKKGKIPSRLKKYGDSLDHIFIMTDHLKEKYGRDFEKIPAGAIGMYSYYDRLAVGLRQFMAGARKFNLKTITRSDLVALTPEASRVSNIPYIMEADREEVEEILRGGLADNGVFQEIDKAPSRFITSKR